MRVFQAIGIASLIVSIASAVLFEDAFVKDWIKHTYGEIQRYDILSEHEILGLTNQEQLVNLNINKNGTLNWKADLRDLGSANHYVVSKNRQFVYVYFTDDNRIAMIDTKLGILQQVLFGESVPLKLVEFFNTGVLVLGSNGQVTFLGNDGSVKPIEIDGAITDIKVTQVDGVAYVITNDLSLVAIQNTLEQATSKPFSGYFSSIKQIKSMEDGVLVTDKNKLLIIEDGEVREIKHHLNSKHDFKLLNRELAYSINSKEICFYSIANGELKVLLDYKLEEEIKEVDIVNYTSSDILLVRTLSSDVMLDVSGLTMGGDASLIQKFEIKKSIIGTKRYILYNSESNLQLVSSLLLDFNFNFEIYSTDNESLNQLSFGLEQFEPSSLKYLIIDRPQSEVEINKVHHLLHDSDNYSFFISRWLGVVVRHLSQLGEFVVSKFVAPPGDEYKSEDTFGFGKLIIFYDAEKKYVVATDSENGSIAWACKVDVKDQDLIDLIDRPATNEILAIFRNMLLSIDIRNGQITNSELLVEEILKALLLKLENEEEVVALKIAHSNKLKIIQNNEIKIKADQYLIDYADGSVNGYKIMSDDLIATWKFDKPQESLVLVESKPINTRTSSIGITLSDKSVLYKYLYPNLISIVTRDIETGIVRYYLLDGISGSVLHTHEHAQNEAIDLNSIQLCMDDNWIIYTFLIKAPKLEQRVIVFDLFDTKEKSVDKPDLVSALEQNSTFNFLSQKSFIFPERILSVASTQTKFGITLKSILFLTESGSLIEMPKFILNSRRIANRALSSKDFQDDFRMMPYETVIPKNNYQVLNHKHQLLLDHATDKILVRPTELESTSVVCFANKLNVYCNVIQPSLSYDLLSQNFDRIKLILTMLALLAAYLITKPFVLSRRLNANWIDR